VQILRWLMNQNGSPVAGFPQTWCTYGGTDGDNKRLERHAHGKLLHEWRVLTNAFVQSGSYLG
jgi:hypothetical protein